MRSRNAPRSPLAAPHPHFLSSGVVLRVESVASCSSCSVSRGVSRPQPSQEMPPPAKRVRLDADGETSTSRRMALANTVVRSEILLARLSTKKTEGMGSIRSRSFGENEGLSVPLRGPEARMVARQRFAAIASTRDGPPIPATLAGDCRRDVYCVRVHRGDGAGSAEGRGSVLTAVREAKERAAWCADRGAARSFARSAPELAPPSGVGR